MTKNEAFMHDRAMGMHRKAYDLIRELGDTREAREAFERYGHAIKERDGFFPFDAADLMWSNAKAALDGGMTKELAFPFSAQLPEANMLLNTYIIVNSTGPFTMRGEAKMIANPAVGKLIDNPGVDSPWEYKLFPSARNRELVRLYTVDGVAEGMWFHEAIVNSQGGSVILFIEPKATKREIERSKAHIRSERDVVRIEEYHVTKWVKHCKCGRALAENVVECASCGHTFDVTPTTEGKGTNP
jgi:hypothetical protein